MLTNSRQKNFEHTTVSTMSAAQVRHGLRRLLRVARRLDGDRIQLRSLLPVAGAHLPSSIDTAHDDAWDGKEEKTSVRSVVLGAVREASGDVSARPEGVRAMSRNAAALEAVIARADLATRAEAAFLASASRRAGSGGDVHVVGLIDVHEPSALSRDEAGEATGLAAPQGRPPRAPRGGAPHL